MFIRVCIASLVFTACAPRGEERNNADASAAPVLTRTIPLPGVGAPRKDVGVPGRIDHLAYDPDTERLFIAALENGSLEVVDLARGERVRSITGLDRPQGIAIAASIGCAVVACGGGTVHMFDTRTLEEKQRLELGRGADNVRYDAKADRVYVTHGTTEGGAVAVLDPRNARKLRDITFRHRPESFQLDPGSPRLFANLPGGVRATQDGVVAIVDRDTGAIQAEIRLTGRARNFPMAFDAGHGRLFVACRRPAKLVMIDTDRNVVAAEADCTDDCDDLFYDAQTDRVLLIGGGFRPDLQEPASSTAPTTGPSTLPDETGAIDVFAIGKDGALRRVAQTPTARHARTGLFVPQRRMIYVAVPPRGERDAEIREYRVAD